MSLPPRIASVLTEHGVSAEMRVGIEDLYFSLGTGVMDALAEITAEEGLLPKDLTPEHLAGIRSRLGERFLREKHGRWLSGEPTPGFWRDRGLDGGASGMIEAEITTSANI